MRDIWLLLHIHHGAVWAGVPSPPPGMGMCGRRLRPHFHPAHARFPWLRSVAFFPAGLQKPCSRRGCLHRPGIRRASSCPQAVPAQLGATCGSVMLRLSGGGTHGKGDRAFCEPRGNTGYPFLILDSGAQPVWPAALCLKVTLPWDGWVEGSREGSPCTEK